MNFELSQVVILNESSIEQRCGDVTVHRTIEAARSYVEPVDVSNNEYFGYQADGTRLYLTVTSNEVTISVAPGVERDPALVRKLLEEAASFVARPSNGDAGPDLMSAPIEILVDLIGFAR